MIELDNEILLQLIYFHETIINGNIWEGATVVLQDIDDSEVH